MSNSHNTQPIRFFHRGEVVEVQGPHPTRSVLQWLREDAHCTGTKEGCNEGDCGACTVVIAELAEPGAQDAVNGLRLQTVNACIQFLPSLQGKALFTVEGLKGQCPGKAGQSGGACAHAHGHSQANGYVLHPVQQALVDCLGSQCGFCTPGFIMSATALLNENPTPTRDEIKHAISGNLCRCTGYIRIIEAIEDVAKQNANQAKGGAN